ncbi:MAG TPA: hypothetical protein VD994_15595 [Prosthecobacter sp.]|nr:hypothetical protein [Prosthecobacter sp.]
MKLIPLLAAVLGATFCVHAQGQVVLEKKAPPAASGHTVTGDGWRMIAGSASRDGVYALAWGLKPNSQAKIRVDENGDAAADEAEAADLVNYVVNLRTKDVLGAVIGKHFGDKPTYNHISNETAWSSDSQFVAQLNNFKWGTANAFVYQVVDDATLSKGTDLIKPVTATVFEHLRGGPRVKKFKKEDFAITLHEARIIQRGAATVLQVEVLGQIPKSGEDDSYFDATVTFDLKPAAKGGAPMLTWTGTEIH